MEDTTKRRQRLKNEWQRAARDKTRMLLTQLDEMMTASQAQAAGRRPTPTHETGVRGERQVLEAACTMLREAIWTPSNTISEGLAVSQAQVFVVVNWPSLSIVAAGVPFFRQFAPVSPAASLSDLVHPEDLVQVHIAATALTHAPAGIDAPRAITVRMRARGLAGWANFHLSLAEGTRGKTLGIWFSPAALPAPSKRPRESKRAAFAAQGAVQQQQDLQQHLSPLGPHAGNFNPASTSRTSEHADLLSSRTIDAVELCNATSTILAASPALCKRLRCLPGKLEGQSLLHLVHPRNASCAFDFIRQNNCAPDAKEMPDMLIGSGVGRKRGAQGQPISDSGGSSGTGDRANTSSGTNDSGGSSDMNDGSKQGSTSHASSQPGVNGSNDGSCSMWSHSQGSVSSVESAGESSGDDNSSPDRVPDRASESDGWKEERGACSFENSDAMSSTSSNLDLEREAMVMTSAFSTPGHGPGSIVLPAAVRSYLDRESSMSARLTPTVNIDIRLPPLARVCADAVDLAGGECS